MTLESIVTSLEISKKLDAAGYPQKESINYWCFLNTEEEPIVVGLKRPKDDEIAAPTAEEILRRLPGKITGPLYLDVQFKGEPRKWRVAFCGSQSIYLELEDSLANAAAQMWIYLKENNFLPSL